jgi:peptidoglycan-N-acetylglucosamine deacetylase
MSESRGKTLAAWVGGRLEWVILHLGRAGGGRALGPLSFWLFWEWLNRSLYRPKPTQPWAFFRYVLSRHHGAPVTLADGTVIADGDLVAEIHLDNVEIARRLSEGEQSGRATSWAWVAIRQMASDLAVLARPGRLPPEVKALHGVTVLARATLRLGFEVRPLPRTLGNDLTRLYMLGLLRIYNPNGDHRLAQAEPDAYPAEIWFGRRSLEKRYVRTAREGEVGGTGASITAS